MFDLRSASTSVHWLFLGAGQNALNLSEFFCHCVARAEKMWHVLPMEHGGQSFRQHVDNHVVCWKMDELDLSLLDSFQDKVDMQQDVA